MSSEEWNSETIRERACRAKDSLVASTPMEGPRDKRGHNPRQDLHLALNNFLFEFNSMSDHLQKYPAQVEATALSIVDKLETQGWSPAWCAKFRELDCIIKVECLTINLREEVRQAG